MAKKYEYKYIAMTYENIWSEENIEKLNELGQDGWKLIKWLVFDNTTDKWGGLFIREENLP